MPQTGPGGGSPAQEGSPAPAAEDPLAKALESIAGQWRPCGLLTEQEQLRAGELCLALLKHLQAWGLAWVPPPAPAAPDEAAADKAVRTPDPRSTCHAVLQLLARLTKQQAVAEAALAAHAHAALLALPPLLFRLELAPYMAAVLRHLLEDPSTLAAAIEAEVRGALAERSRGGAQPCAQRRVGWQAGCRRCAWWQSGQGGSGGAAAALMLVLRPLLPRI